MTVKKCREEIIKELYVEKIEDHKNILHFCYKCNSEIEPRLSLQYFVKMVSLANKTLEVLHKNEIEILPKNNLQLIYDWLNNIRDWCISRQIVFGHSIPIWHCQECKHINCEISTPNKCYACKSKNLKKETDVLDTWFSSWLFAFAIYNEEELKYYYPNSIVITNTDILFFWVVRMIMAGLEFTDKIPFKKIYLHGIIRNTIDPTEIINKFSTDILRYTLCFMMPFEQDLNLSLDNFNIGKKFCTKLWNSVHYIISKIDGEYDININNLEFNIEDTWILNKYIETNNYVITEIDNMQFMSTLKKIHNFLLVDFCNTYLEINKLSKKPNNIMLLYIVTNILILLHPYIPFITEELFDILKSKITNIREYKSIMNCKLTIIKSNNNNNNNIFNEFMYVVDLAKKNKQNTLQINKNDNIYEYIHKNENLFIKLSNIKKIEYI
jgi:valyl-tRNA synthetase